MADLVRQKPIESACGAARGPDERAAEQFWTIERRARARPVPLPNPGPGGGQSVTTGEASVKAPPGYSPGQLPPGYADDANRAAGFKLGDIYGPQGAVEVPHPLVYPYCTVGKLFYTQNGRADSGSAALICPNILLTAGHCVYDKDNGGRSTNLAFYPSYGSRDEKDTLYKFEYSYIAWQQAWAQNKNWAYDYGLVWIDGDPGKQLGWLGYAWNQPLENRIWTAVGYPAPNALVGGTIMYATTGRYVPNSNVFPGVFGLTNERMGHGSSGGPWISQMPWTVDPANAGQWSHQQYHANGVQSFLRLGTAYSPYFTQEVRALVDWISDPANRI